MDNFIQFLNNFRNNTAQWERDLSQRTNEALGRLGNEIGRGFQSVGNGIGNAVQGVTQPINNTAQNIGNSISGIAQGANQAASGIANSLAESPIGNQNIMGTGIKAPNASYSQAQTSAQQAPAGTQYQRDLGIDTFISALRTIMNPLRGITGETPLDAVTNAVSDSLYTKYGKKVETPVETKNSENTEDTKTADNTESNTTNTDNKTDSSETIVYTYTPGDTFGAVIKKLGLGTDKGLWGAGGDVEYYTEQLREQGAMDRRGNIPVGTTIRLKRRK